MATPERWKQVERLLDQVLDLAPAERAAFLDQACGDDRALRAEVERLLGAAEAEGRSAGWPDEAVSEWRLRTPSCAFLYKRLRAD